MLLVLIITASRAAILGDEAHKAVVPCPGIRTGASVPDCPCGSSGFAFEDVAPRYRNLLDVKARARNVTSGTLYIDPSQAGIPLLFRWNGASNSWDEVDTWRCANVGMGTKRPISPNATVGLDVRNSSAVVDLKQGPSVILFDDTELPTLGQYRLGVRYSAEFWPAMVDLAMGRKFTECRLQLSPAFSVEGD